MSAATLYIDIRHYWHAGGGRGAGAVLDAVVHRDPNGLPLLPGRHLKGLLRDALTRAEAWEWEGFASGTAEQLFGRPADGNQPSEPGALRVTDATLPGDVAAWLASDNNDKGGKCYLPYLFRSLYATAIDHESGTARDKSLRGIEVTVPLTLSARITPVPGREPPEGWPGLLAAVLPLIDAVGAHRSRGLGRAVLRIEEERP